MEKIRVGITLRVDNIESINEKRDALSQDWVKFLQEVGITPVFIPNNIKNLENFLDEMRVDGIILSGGDNIGDFPERDKTEEDLINYAKNNNLLMIGICRGMQVLNNYFGGSLEKSDNSEHVANPHAVDLTNKKIINLFGQDSIPVNSFHNNLILKEKIGKDFEIFAITKNDQTVEGFFHKKFPFVGVMWHPERDEKIENELKLFNAFLKKIFWNN